MSSNDPLAPIQGKDQADTDAIAARQAADRSQGKAVSRPNGYRIATKEERRELITKAKKLVTEKKQLPDILKELGAEFTFGHWWVKE